MPSVQSIYYARIPEGEVKLNDGTFESKTVDVSDEQLNGGVFVQLIALSVDPYVRMKRGWRSDGLSCADECVTRRSKATPQRWCRDKR